VKNIALCFDRSDVGGTSNAAALVELLSCDEGQMVWSRTDPARTGRPGLPGLRRRSPQSATARAVIAEAYEFLVEHWVPGDRILVFGAGRGAFCARALTRLLGTVGVLRDTDPSGCLRDYVLATYAVPRTRRDAADWRRIADLAVALAGGCSVAVDVEFLGLWDTVAVPGAPRQETPESLPNVRAARHAVAIDGGPFGAQSLEATSADVQEVWFRGSHRDVTGAGRACAPLADLTLDWVLDGAVRAGATVRAGLRHWAPVPNAAGALAQSTHPVSFRKVPPDAAVHASVECHLRADPSYWRRLPAQIVWADQDWLARGERLMTIPSGSRATSRASAPAEEPVLATVS
jgi:hypothetical protein